MNINFIVYHDIKTEYRTQRILSVLKKIGDVKFISYSDPSELGHNNYLITGKGKRKYFSFLFETITYLIKNKKKDSIIVLHDNYCAPLLFFCKKFIKPYKIIYDSSEFFTYKNKQKSGNFLFRCVDDLLIICEKLFLKKADIVIAANKERAMLMKQYFQLNRMPLIFENIHRINDKINYKECDTKYSHLFEIKKFTLVYPGGILRDRLTKELAVAVTNLGEEYRLLIAGNVDWSYYNEIIKETNKNKNIVYVGFVSRAELKYLFFRGNVGVSFFDMDIPNNRFCASGKIYECLFCGNPILTSINPPLNRLCKNHQIGLSIDKQQIEKGILELKNHYNDFRRNVLEYIKSVEPEMMEEELAKKLKQFIYKKDSK